MTRILSFDTETYLITATDKAPKPVVCLWCDGGKPFLTRPDDIATYALWSDPATVFVGQNIAYDIIVMMRWHPSLIPHIVRALDEGRVFDIGLRHSIMHLAAVGAAGYDPRISLATMAKLYLNKDIAAQKKGDDIWRLKFGTLDGVPFDQWPAEALAYCMDDASMPWHIFQLQGGLSNIQPTETAQVRSAVVLNAIGTWGFKIDRAKREQLRGETMARIAPLEQKVAPLGWTGEGSKKKLAAAVLDGWRRLQWGELTTYASATGAQLRLEGWQTVAESADVLDHLRLHIEQRTVGLLVQAGDGDNETWCRNASKAIQAPKRTGKTLAISTSEEDIEPIKQHMTGAADFFALKHEQKVLSTYLSESTDYDEIHPQFVNLVSTGRTGCREPNTQNWLRDGGLRDMFLPRDGMQFGIVDYSQLELCTLAATMRTFWPDVRCTLGEAIDAGKDVHCITGGQISGIPYEKMIAGKKSDDTVKRFRQASKACVSEHSPVLTKRGWVSICHVKSDDLLWDGVEWVVHGGVVKKGKQLAFRMYVFPVYVTADHLIYLGNDEWRRKDDMGPATEVEARSVGLASLDASGVGTSRWVPNFIGPAPYDHIFTETYDIINCGPRNRFQCGPYLVHNCNFGLPGGLGVTAFQAYAKGNYGVEMSRGEAFQSITGWKRTWPELPGVYLKSAHAQIDTSPGGLMTASLINGRLKAGCTYTMACNYRFQGLAADGAKAALWTVWRECVLGWYWSRVDGHGYGHDLRDSPLRESKLVNFIHDELVMEHRSGDQEALKRQEDLMVSEMRAACLHKVLIAVEGHLADRWNK